MCISLSNKGKPIILLVECDDLPNWLQSLVDSAIGLTTSNTHCQFISAAVILDLIKLSDLSAETESRTHPLNRTRSAAQSDNDIELVAVSIRPPIESHILLKVKSKLIVSTVLLDCVYPFDN